MQLMNVVKCFGIFFDIVSTIKIINNIIIIIIITTIINNNFD